MSGHGPILFFGDETGEMYDNISTLSLCGTFSFPVGTLMLSDTDPSHGKVDLSRNTNLTITNSAIFYVGCGSNSSSATLTNITESVAHFYDKRAPFYGSISPVVYTLSGVVALAWLLLLLLVVSRKRRPFLQKLSMTAVACVLTATLWRTSVYLERQYRLGYQDSDQLCLEVMGSTSFQIPQIVIQSIMWIAHLQIAVRMFSKPSEIAMVRVIGIILLALEVIFWCVGYFAHPGLGRTQPWLNTKSNPWLILAYSFEIALAFTYATCMFIFSLRKRRYAYCRSNWMSAFLSLISLVSPLIFMGLCSGRWIMFWAVYCAFVANACSAVILWDWLDSIERLEKQEQMNGVMGRPVYEDEMVTRLNATRRKPSFSSDADTTDAGSGTGSSATGGTKDDVQFQKKSFNRDSRHLLGRTFDRIPYLASIFQLPETWDRLLGMAASPVSLWTSSSDGSSGMPRGEARPNTGVTSGNDVAPSNDLPEDVIITHSRVRHVPAGNKMVKRYIHPVRKVTIDEIADDDGDIYDPAPPQTSAVPNSTTADGSENIEPERSAPLEDAAGPEDPPVFQRLPGFDDGDYWDEKTAAGPS